MNKDQLCVKICTSADKAIDGTVKLVLKRAKFLCIAVMLWNVYSWWHVVVKYHWWVLALLGVSLIGGVILLILTRLGYLGAKKVIKYCLSKHEVSK